MSMHIKNRRVFLSQLGILTAAVALSRTAFASEASAGQPNPEFLWNQFCKLRGAVDYHGKLEVEKTVDSCKGHEQRKGKLVWLPQEKIIAQPIWIHWSNQPHKPSDLIVNFYSEQRKALTINQYELAYFNNDMPVSDLGKFLASRNKGQSFWTARVSSNGENRTLV